MQLFGVTDIRPGVVADGRDGSGIEPANFSQHGLGQHATHFDGAGAAFFKRGIVKVRVRIGVENLVRKLLGRGGVNGKAGDAPAGNVAQHAIESFEV